MEQPTQQPVIQPTGQVPQPESPKSSNRFYILLGCVLVLILIVLGGYAVLKGQSPSSTPPVASTSTTATTVPSDISSLQQEAKQLDSDLGNLDQDLKEVDTSIESL